MERIPFGSTGLTVSRLGFGSAPIGYLGRPTSEVEPLLQGLLDLGINVLDTAASYPGSEQAIGAAVGNRRDQFVLVSKCGQAFEDLPGAAWSAQVITATIDRALKRLRTDRLDVMLLHSCSRRVLEQGEALGALARARDAGKVRFPGYSGDNDAVAFAATLPDVRVIETSINLTDQVNIDGVLPVARERGLGVIVKRPIANAAWKQPSEQPGMYASYAQDYHDRFKAMGLTLSDTGLTGDAKLQWPAAALRFTLSFEGVHTAIVGTTNLDHVRSNVEAVDQGPLPEHVVQTLRDKFNAAAKGQWHGLT